jgi:hypothetical protein
MKYLIPTKLVGVSFENPDGTKRQELIKNLKENETLTILHELNNPYDANSHIIRNENNDTLGHLSKALAQELVDKIGRGEKLIGITEWKRTGENQMTKGLNILIQMEKQEVI